MPTNAFRARRGRPQVMDPETRKERILQAAEQVFATHGYAEASIDLIAQQAGMSRRTIYRFFASKEALFADLVLSSVPAWQEGGRAGGGGLEDDIFQLMTDVVDRAYTPRNIRTLQLVVAEITQSPQLAILFREKSVDRGRRFLADGFASVLAAHRLSLDEDFDQWSDILFGATVAAPMVHALVGDWTSHDRARIDRRIRRLATMIATLLRRDD